MTPWMPHIHDPAIKARFGIEALFYCSHWPCPEFIWEARESRDYTEYEIAANFWKSAAGSNRVYMSSVADDAIIFELFRNAAEAAIFRYEYRKRHVADE